MTTSGQNSQSPKEPDKKLLSEGRWSNRYQIGAQDLYESKLVTGYATISRQSLILEWESWSTDDKLEFVRAFSAKPSLTHEDERILTFLLQQQDDRISAMLAICLTAHSDKEMVFQFLTQRAEFASVDKGNYFQALAILDDKRAVPQLHRFYIENVGRLGIIEQNADVGDAFDLLMCCAALGRLTQDQEYRNQLSVFQHHPNETISKHANALLKIWYDAPST